MKRYKIYGKKDCPGCDTAKALLDSLGVGYEYVDVLTTQSAQALFREWGFRTVPQIFVDGEHIGGVDALRKNLGM